MFFGADGFIQAYNAQLAVDEGHQATVACGVTNQPRDAANFVSMIERVYDNVGDAPAHDSKESTPVANSSEIVTHPVGPLRRTGS